MFISIFLTILSIVTIIPIPTFWIYGVIIAFKTHLLVGVIALVIEPLPFIIGVGQGIWHTDIAIAIAKLLRLL